MNYKKKIDRISYKANQIKKKQNSGLLKNVVAIIPARGGSKRFKRKNMYNVWGKPMIFWTINEARKSKLINNIYVSSEDKEIKNYARRLGAKIIDRPKNLSKDEVFKMDVIRHAVKQIEKNKKPTLVLSLQANSPNISYFDIDKALNHLIRFDRSEVISVDENLNQNGAIRAMRYKSVFQNSLSTDVGFIVTKILDVHYKKDLKKLED